MNRLLMAMIVASLSGCALLPVRYKEPDTGPMATIRFKNESSKVLELAYFETSKQCTGRREVGSLPPSKTLTSKVRGDEELTFQYHLSKGTGSPGLYCLVNLRFSPRNHGYYVFLTDDDALGCKWIMLDASRPGPPQPVDLKRLKWTAGWDENSSFCSE